MITSRFVFRNHAGLALSVSPSAYTHVLYYARTHRWETLVVMLQNVMAKCEGTVNSVAIVKLGKSLAKRRRIS